MRIKRKGSRCEGKAVYGDIVGHGVRCGGLVDRECSEDAGHIGSACVVSQIGSRAAADDRSAGT